MRVLKIDLDWRSLLGFDQANPGAKPLATLPKIGEKDAQGFCNMTASPLQAKVGDKQGGGGTIGRPQELGLLLGR